MPIGSYTMGQLLADSQAVAGTTVAPVWVDEPFVAAAEANYRQQNRGMFPIWHALSGDGAAASSVSGVRACAAGLHNRPVRETIRDLLAWWKTLPEERTGRIKAGMSSAQETELLALWKKRHG